MSSLFITEFDQLTIDANGVPPFGKFDANTKGQTVTFGDTSAAFQPTTRFVRVAADAACTISYTPPGADSAIGSTYIAANMPGESFGVDPAGTISVASAS